MAGDSYTLREVAELLGVSKRTLQRRIKEGAFAGRFLAPGRHGLETRIPSEEVQRALEDLRGRGPGHATTPASADLTDSLVPYATPAQSNALTHTDLDSLRDAMIAIVREDRETFLATVQQGLVSRDRELAALRGQIGGLSSAIERLRKRLESGDLLRPAVAKREVATSPTTEGLGPFDVDSVLREIDAIERLLSEMGS